MKYVQSSHPNHRVEVNGFGKADESAHMIEWLHRGADFREFIVRDIETELYSQDPAAQLLSVTCTSDLDFETKARRIPGNETQAVVTEIPVTFPLAILVRAGNGILWRLNVMHNYQASHMGLEDEFSLRMNFRIVAARSD